jgi:hypothetical protein
MKRSIATVGGLRKPARPVRRPPLPLAQPSSSPQFSVSESSKRGGLSGLRSVCIRTGFVSK